MKNNPYFENAGCMLKIVEKSISSDVDNMNLHEMLQPVLFFAIGVESLLKGILYDVNKLLVYESVSIFKAALHIYANNEADEKTKSLSLEKSFECASYFSEKTKNNKTTISNLGKTRNTIVHGLVSDLEKSNLESILNNFKRVISEYQNEIGCNLIDNPLSSEELQKIDRSLKDKIQEKLNEHKKLWNKKQKDKEFLKDARYKTATNQKCSTNDITFIKCPACEQPALLYWTCDDYDFDYHGNQIFHKFISSFYCFFCELQIQNSKEIDYLKFSEEQPIEINWDSEGKKIA